MNSNLQNNSEDEDQVDVKELDLITLKEKECKISIPLIIKTSLDQDIIELMNEDQKIDQLMILKTLHLEFLNIKIIENLDIFTNVQVLFLQNNLIQKIENLDTLINLEYLDLKNNKIQLLEGLQINKKLGYLDISYNEITSINIQQIPESIEILNYIENPIINDINIRKKLLCKLKYIDEMNSIKIDQYERFQALGIFPEEVQQYQKKIIQRKIKQMNKFKKLDEALDIDKVDIQKSDVMEEDNDNLTQETINQFQNLTENLVEKAQTTQMEDLFMAQKELLEYQQLHTEIRRQIYEHDIQSKIQ